jgi:hypothetical protein
MKLTTYLQVMAILRECKAICAVLHIPSLYAQGQLYLFAFMNKAVVHSDGR